MNKWSLCFFLFLGITPQAFLQQTRILFIGNSYTYVNDLPGTFSQLALSLGDSVYYDSNTPGGSNFNQHATDPTCLAQIATPGWDYVVLQDQSQEPAFPPAQVATDTYPWAKRLDSLVHAANPCAITMFYMTWGRKYGDASNCAFYPPLCTFSGMTDRLRQSYLWFATDFYARVSPVGIAWRNAWEADSSINLWIADDSHPSVAGTYLTACVFYAAIFHQSPVGATYTAGLTGPQASFLQHIASQTVFDSSNVWMLHQNPVHAAFTDTIAQSQVDFHPQTYNAHQFWWDFGDGVGYSSLENSSYFYTSPGTYHVQFIASNGCYADTAEHDVTIAVVGLDDTNMDPEIILYPNPSTGYIYVKNIASDTPFCLYNSQGSIIMQGKLSSAPVDLTGIAPGAYYLHINNKHWKMIIQ